MAKIVGMNGGQQPPQQPKIDLSKATEISCQNCGGTIFIPGSKFLKISKHVAGTPQDVLVPVGVQLCGDCGELCEELLPEQLQVKKDA